MNKSADYPFLFRGMTVIKNADLYRHFNQVLDNVLNRYSFMVFMQLVFTVYFPEKYAFHSHIWFYNKRIIKSGSRYLFFHFFKRKIMHDVNGTGHEMRG